MSWQRTVGVAVSRSGATDAIGESVVRGIELAIEDLQETGDSAVTARIDDTGGDPERAAEVAESQIDDGCPVVVGPISSDVALGVREVAERRQVPLLPAVGGNPEVTEPGTRYTFRYAGNNSQNARGTLEFFREVGVDRMAVVGADFSYPRAVARHLREYAPEYGLEVGPVEHTPLGTTDFSDQLAAIDPERVDGIFLPYPGNNATTLLQQLQETGLFGECVVVGDYSFGSIPYQRRLERSMADTHNWGIDTVGPRYRELAARLDGPAGVYHMLGYDIGRIAGEALAAVED
ncbi:MAG: ABC transporter substrate-binding protein, partial [Haloferacaceae archaeon]